MQLSPLRIRTAGRHALELRTIVGYVEPRRLIFREDVTLYLDVRIRIQGAQCEPLASGRVVEPSDDDGTTASTERAELTGRRLIER